MTLPISLPAWRANDFTGCEEMTFSTTDLSCRVDREPPPELAVVDFASFALAFASVTSWSALALTPGSNCMDLNGSRTFPGPGTKILQIVNQNREWELPNCTSTSQRTSTIPASVEQVPE